MDNVWVYNERIDQLEKEVEELEASIRRVRQQAAEEVLGILADRGVDPDYGLNFGRDRKGFFWWNEPIYGKQMMEIAGESSGRTVKSLIDHIGFKP